MLATAWLKEANFQPKKIKKKWFDVKSRAKRDVAVCKKEAGRTGGVRTQFQNQWNFSLKFQTLWEAYALKVYPATILATLVTTDEKTMQVTM